MKKIDPSKNVQALSKADARRQDDLREARAKLDDACHLHNERVIALHADYQAKLLELHRTNDSIVHNMEQAQQHQFQVHSEHDREALRRLISDTAASITSQIDGMFGRVLDRVAALERTAAEGRGKELVSDPLMAQLLTEVKAIAATQNTGTGTIKGIGVSWGAIVGSAGIVLALVTIMSYFSAHSLVPVLPQAQTQTAPAPAR